MADYDIFREQLLTRYSTYGHALWEPSPSKPSDPVKVGDVGFIRSGRFHRLFNALLSAEDQSNVPENYEQLIPKSPDHIVKGSLSSDHYCSAGISVEYESDFHASSPDDLPRVLFLNSRRGGAVMSLPVDARREDTQAMGDFRGWILKHIDHWFAFARERGLGIERMEEIILVTGCDHTRSWTNVAFFADQYNAQASFGVKVVQGPPLCINWQPSPEHVRGAVIHRGPGGTDLPEDQCVFIRGFRVARSFWKLPRRLKAAAEPSSDLDDYDYDPDTEVISIPGMTTYRDPLHLLQDYIAEREPDCDMYLVHDDDLIKIYELCRHDDSPKAFEPDVMMDLLRRSNIEIDTVTTEILTEASTQKDSSPSNSGPNAERSMVKVAMLSMLPTTSRDWSNLELPILEAIIGIKSSLTALKKDRGHFIVSSESDVNSLYRAVIKQVTVLNDVREDDTVYNSRLDTLLADVFNLLSLFFLTIGKTKEAPATYSQLASMRQILVYMDESSAYNDSDLTPFRQRFNDLRAIIKSDSESGKYPEVMTKLLERQLWNSESVLNRMQDNLSVLSDEILPLHEQVVIIRRKLVGLNGLAAKGGAVMGELRPLRDELRKINWNLNVGRLVNGETLWPVAGNIPASQAISCSSLLEECFDIIQDIRALEESKHVAPSLKPIYDRLTGIRTELEGLALTNRWTLRETDLRDHSRRLQEVDKMRIDGNFVNSDGARSSGQYVLLYHLRRCYGIIYRFLSSSEPVSEELMPIANELLTVKKCLKEALRYGELKDSLALYSSMVAHQPEFALHQIDSRKKDGKFVAVDGTIPEGQGIVLAHLNECHVLLEMLKEFTGNANYGGELTGTMPRHDKDDSADIHHDRRLSGSTRTNSSPTAATPFDPDANRATNEGCCPPLEKSITRIFVTGDSCQYHPVDITGFRNVAFIKEVIFSKLRVEDEEQSQYSVYRTDIGAYALGEALPDEQLYELCRDHGDAKGSLKFLVAKSSAVVHGRNQPSPAASLSVSSMQPLRGHWHTRQKHWKHTKDDKYHTDAVKQK